MKKYLSLFVFLFLLTGCGKKDASELIGDASELIKNNNITGAVVLFEEIIKEHPESREASVAMYELGKIYQSKLLKNINETESLTKAIYYFDEVYQKHPSSPEAPLALFMKGFILANDLNQLDEATKTYKLFVEKYPNHDLTSSAQDELNYMGLSPEQILQKKSSVTSK
ncbi:MAG: tetratricopeptide repeat protein [Ignavibacteria bacterium]|nr:tetratricopeptide repeat protein [Ignavibacteria bacterium]MDP3831380.1 tetratricopeptide repeat protein [Ignavibacteriaceae bacterium]